MITDIKTIGSKDYNYNFSIETGLFARWVKKEIFGQKTLDFCSKVCYNMYVG